MEENETIESRQYLALVLRWLWLIVLAALMAAGSAFVTSRLSTPIYEASTVLLISEGEKPAGPDYNAILLSERLAKTYAEMLKGREVLDRAGAQLGAAIVPGDVTVEPVRDTQLISLKVRHPDPALAARIANAIPQVFAALDEQIQAARFATAREGLSRELEATQAEVETAQRSMDAERAKALPSRAELDRLAGVVAQGNATYESLMRSLEEIRVAEATGRNTMAVVEPAEVPEIPVLPRTATNTALAAVVGAMLAVGTAFLVEYLDDTVKTPEDVQRAFRLSTLASILRFRRGVAAAGPLVAAGADTPAAEGYRLLRTNLQFATLGMGHSAVTLLVTSAQPQEGKTTTLANLGASLALAGKRVLLIDADLRRPALHELFGLPNGAGVTSLLVDPAAEAERAILETGIPGLRLLPSGPIPPNPAELLDCPGMAALLRRLAPSYDQIILDSPPAAGLADAAILAQKADGTLLVAEVGGTRRQALAQTVAALAAVNARLLGVVLNKVGASGDRYYDRYYHYGRGAGRKGKRAARSRRSKGQGGDFGGEA